MTADRIISRCSTVGGDWRPLVTFDVRDWPEGTYVLANVVATGIRLRDDEVISATASCAFRVESDSGILVATFKQGDSTDAWLNLRSRTVSPVRDRRFRRPLPLPPYQILDVVVAGGASPVIWIGRTDVAASD